LRVATESSNQQNLGRGDLHRLKASNRLGDLQIHPHNLFLGDFEALN
jgi:hypothetical protein